ncbi:MAG: hypothetical protein NT004_15695 [Bacteroidetes bacterium]|nr:hypothetical protein [Bacteroidota bacterium]
MKRLLNLPVIAMFILLLSVLLGNGCRKNDGANYIPVGSKVLTTLDRTLIPVPMPIYLSVGIHDAANFDQYGYGQFTYGPGITCQKRLDLMPAGNKSNFWFNADSSGNRFRVIQC